MRTFEICGNNWSCIIRADVIGREDDVASLWSYDTGFICSVDLTTTSIREI